MSVDEGATEGGSQGQLSTFLLGVGSWFGAFGLHGVLFSSLLVVYLNESEVRVGAAQSAVMLPAVLLILVGGAVADRVDRRRLMAGVHTAGILASLGLAFAVGQDLLSYGLVILYALVLGTAQAFGNPARDAMLSEVVQGEMGRAVAGMTLTQWGTQAVGAIAGGLARVLGAGPVLVGQALVYALGIPAFAKLPHTAPRHDHPPLHLRDITSGVREVFASPILLPSLVMVCAVGVMFIGPFMVVFPLMVRDVYGGGVAEISYVSTCFPIGTIIGSMVLMKRGGVRRKGPAQLGALALGSVLMLLISVGLPFGAMLCCVIVWGHRRLGLHGGGPHLLPGARQRGEPRARALDLHPWLHGGGGRPRGSAVWGADGRRGAPGLPADPRAGNARPDGPGAPHLPDRPLRLSRDTGEPSSPYSVPTGIHEDSSWLLRPPPSAPSASCARRATSRAPCATSCARTCSTACGAESRSSMACWATTTR